MAEQGKSGAADHTPYDNTSEIAALEFIIRQLIKSDVHTAKLVKVVAVKGGAGAVAKVGTVDVQPLVSMVDGDGNATEHGTIHGLPWVRTHGGNGAIIADPKVGDVGMIICADRDSSAVTGGSVVTPGSDRSHDFADGIYIGSVYNDVPDQYVQFTEDAITINDKSGNKVELKTAGTTITDKNGNVIEMSSTGVKVTPTGSTLTVQGNLALTGNLQLGGAIEGETAGSTYSGDLKFGGEIYARYGVSGQQVKLTTHQHTQPNDSAGNVQASTNPPLGGT